jgi:hypothetical protein
MPTRSFGGRSLSERARCNSDHSPGLADTYTGDVTDPDGIPPPLEARLGRNLKAARLCAGLPEGIASVVS